MLFFLAFQGFSLRDEKCRASYRAVFASLVLGPMLLAFWCSFYCGHCTQDGAVPGENLHKS